MGPFGEAVPDAGDLAAGERVSWRTRYAEAEVHASVAERERPGVSGKQIGLEPHPQCARRCFGRGAIAAERVPVAPIARRADAKRLSDPGVDPIRSDDESGRHAGAIAEHGDLCTRPLLVFVEAGELDA